MKRRRRGALHPPLSSSSSCWVYDQPVWVMPPCFPLPTHISPVWSEDQSPGHSSIHQHSGRGHQTGMRGGVMRTSDEGELPSRSFKSLITGAPSVSGSEIRGKKRQNLRTWFLQTQTVVHIHLRPLSPDLHRPAPVSTWPSACGADSSLGSEPELILLSSVELNDLHEASEALSPEPGVSTEDAAASLHWVWRIHVEEAQSSQSCSHEGFSLSGSVFLTESPAARTH
ncbi:unnamed protein product [Pleuronectes platessa]|uniref:Uncharacterized protein n=1 Tax=Pleuronectes platessa TaxID=8262 RepID=A0A9N7TS90_PLEPL|nr:unnamed protein product [Pleuronectes platessa]